MIKKLAVVAVCASFTAVGGCSFDDLVAELSSPAATQAATNVKTVTQAFACGLGVLSGAALQVMQEKALKGQTVDGLVYVSSSTACSLLGGIVVVPTPVAVPAGTAVVS